MPENTPWLGGGMSATQPQADQSNSQTHAPGDVQRLLTQPTQPAVKKRGYHRFELPESVTKSVYWKGPDADRFFGMWEPKAGEIRKIAKGEARWEVEAPNYIAALGVPRQTTVGDVERAPPLGDAAFGTPVLADVTDNTAQVMPWWERLPSKAQQLITGLFIEFCIPSNEEGETLRASSQWVG